MIWRVTYTMRDVFNQTVNDYEEFFDSPEKALNYTKILVSMNDNFTGYRYTDILIWDSGPIDWKQVSLHEIPEKYIRKF